MSDLTPLTPDDRLKIYIEPRDWWVGYYRGETHHYVCPLPTVVVRWRRADRHVFIWPSGDRIACACERTTDHPVSETMVRA